MITQRANFTISEFENLKKYGVFHFTTTRQGWKIGDKSRFTFKENGNHEFYLSELKDQLILDCKLLLFPKQTHSSNVLIVNKSTQLSELENADALICGTSGIAIGIQTADCVPILLYDPKNRVVAAIHAGWRGTVDLIVVKTIAKMVSYFDSKPQDIIAGIGPSISKINYEVGGDVIKQFECVFPNENSILTFSKDKKGKAFVDLWQANKFLLLKSGINENNIEISGLCSFENEELFYSARRDGIDTGRMASVIML